MNVKEIKEHYPGLNYRWVIFCKIMGLEPYTANIPFLEYIIWINSELAKFHNANGKNIKNEPEIFDNWLIEKMGRSVCSHA